MIYKAHELNWLCNNRTLTAEGWVYPDCGDEDCNGEDLDFSTASGAFNGEEE